MADLVFNIAKGRVAHYASLPASSDALTVVLLKLADADDTLEDYDDLASLIAAAGNTEADFTNYTRKTATVTLTVDDTGNTASATFTDLTWSAAGGATNNSLVKALVCYVPDTATSTDADIIPLTLHDFVAATDGTDLTLRLPADGFYITVENVQPTEILSPDSQWRLALGTVSQTDVFYDGAQLESTTFIGDQITKERAAGQGPWLATSNSTSFVWIARPDTPRRKINVRTDLAIADRLPLQELLNSVPIEDSWYTTWHPDIPSGDDSVLTVYDPAEDTLYEVYYFRRKNGPGASGTLPNGDPDWDVSPYYDGADPDAYGSGHWGGVTKNASKSYGVFDGASYPPWSRPSWGASAGSHIFCAGLIRQEELEAGVIPHAIAVDWGKMHAGITTWPAFRTDGLSLDQYAPNYGAHFRIDPTLDLDDTGTFTFATPLAKMIAKAIQTYGMIFRNQTGGAFTIFCEDPRPSGNPNAFYLDDGNPNPDGYLQGLQPPAALDGIPWSSLLQIGAKNHQEPGTTMAVRGDVTDKWRVAELERMVGKSPAVARYVSLFLSAPRHDASTASLGIPGIECGGAIAKCTTTSGSPTITASTTVSFTGGTIVAGQTVVGDGIPAGTTVLSVSGATVTLSANATASASNVFLTFAEGNGYQRVATADTDWNNAVETGTNVHISNAVAFDFPTPTGDWGTPVAWGIHDAQQGENSLLAFGWIPPSQREAIASGAAVSIPIDGGWFEDMAISTYPTVSVA